MTKLKHAEEMYHNVRIETIHKALVDNYDIAFIEEVFVDLMKFNSGWGMIPEWIKKINPAMERYIVPKEYRGKGVTYIAKFSRKRYPDPNCNKAKYYSSEELFYEAARAINRANTKGSWTKLCKKLHLTKVEYVPSFGEFVEECVKTHLVDA